MLWLIVACHVGRATTQEEDFRNLLLSEQARLKQPNDLVELAELLQVNVIGCGRALRKV